VWLAHLARLGRFRSRLIIDLLLGWFFPIGVFQDNFVSKYMVSYVCIISLSQLCFIMLG
jgi:hypothetical protein